MGQISANQYQQYTWSYTKSNGSVVTLANTYVTSTSGSSFPTIGGNQMSAGKEYWVFAVDIDTFKSDYDNDLFTSLSTTCASTSSSANISLAKGATFFKAAEGSNSSWQKAGSSTTLHGKYSFTLDTRNSKGDGVLQMVSLQFDSGVPSNWYWVQTGEKNLTWSDLNGVVMATTSTNTIPSGDYYADSAFSSMTAS